MTRFLIERVIPGASDLTEAQLAEISGKSNSTVASLGVPYRWITSYVAGDKVYCIHEADDEDTIREHARRGGFPADVVSVVAASSARTPPADRAACWAPSTLHPGRIPARFPPTVQCRSRRRPGSRWHAPSLVRYPAYRS